MQKEKTAVDNQLQIYLNCVCCYPMTLTRHKLFFVANTTIKTSLIWVLNGGTCDLMERPNNSDDNNQHMRCSSYIGYW